jgi:hypothetical protein
MRVAVGKQSNTETELSRISGRSGSSGDNGGGGVAVVVAAAFAV